MAGWRSRLRKFFNKKKAVPLVEKPESVPVEPEIHFDATVTHNSFGSRLVKDPNRPGLKTRVYGGTRVFSGNAKKPNKFLQIARISGASIRHLDNLKEGVAQGEAVIVSLKIMDSSNPNNVKRESLFKTLVPIVNASANQVLSGPYIRSHLDDNRYFIGKNKDGYYFVFIK